MCLVSDLSMNMTRPEVRLWTVCLLVVLSVVCNGSLAFEPYLFKTEQPQIVVYPNVLLTPERLQNTRLFRLARHVQQLPRERLLRFVQVSLEEMATIYHDEALQARQKSLETTRQRNKLIRWSRDSLAFANRLQALGKSVHPDTSVQLYFESFGELYFTINGRPVLVSSPVLNQQKTLEQRIINRICREFTCDKKLMQAPAEELQRRVWVHARWEISDNNRHVLATKKGLNFIFDDLDNKQRKQHVCLNIARDMNLVADALLDVREKGLFIDWGFMYLDVIPGSEQYELVINQFKDAIRLSLTAIPYLNDYPQVAIPWLQARIAFEDYQFDFYNADELVATLSN